jgi:protein TonB
VNAIRGLTLFFSLCLHGSVAAIIFFFSNCVISVDGEQVEQVYHVALAELAQPGILQPFPAPEVMAPLTAPPAREAEFKVNSAIKPKPNLRARAAPQAAPAAAGAPGGESPVPAPASMPENESSTASGPSPRQFDGLAAYEQDHIDQRPSVVRRVEPEYPARAIRMRIEGTALVEMVVDTDGMPQACVVRSAQPPGYFEEAVLYAAQKTRFTPGKLKGRPVNTLVVLPFAFRLR